MKTRKYLYLIVCLAFAFPFANYAESELFSRYPTEVPGKQMVSIHSYSAQTRLEEGPVNMLFPEARNNEDKWCDNTSAQPWVIFELLSYYKINKFIITDGRIREKNQGNIAEYKIYVTTAAYDASIPGWGEDAWQEVYHGVDQGADSIKTIELTEPVEARFVKFEVLNKGNTPNGTYENAVRVYGFDMYGEYSGPVDRGELISVGKTILKFEERGGNRREWAFNILDGNVINGNSKWGIPSYGQENNFHYAVIDLENMYDIKKFKLFDADYAEPGTKNLDGVNIYVSTVAPNLGSINMIDPDPNTCWTMIVSSESESDKNEKEYTYSDSDDLWKAPVKARFVKLEIPAAKAPDADPGRFTRIFQFEVYGTEAAVSDSDATLSLLTVSEGTLNPDFSVEELNYTVDVSKETNEILISASPNNKEALVAGAGLKSLELGSNTFSITVTSKDGTQTKTYTLTVNRALKSKIATLSSLNTSVGFMSPRFEANKLEYFIDVPYGTTEITLSGTLTQADAQVSGLGTVQLTPGQINDLTVSVTSEDKSVTIDYQISVEYEEEGLISVNYGSPVGKRIVNIHSYSDKANNNENAYKLLIGKRLNTNGNTSNKWCDNKTAEPWVILSLTDIYEISKIIIRDGKLVESSNVNVANVESYSVKVSTTGVEDEDFEEIASDFPEDGTNIIEINDLAAKARYIKFTFTKGTKADGNVASAVWIYGIDIYGKKAQEVVDRGKIISVGKTILSRSSNYSDRETPCNLLDGNVNYTAEDSQGEIKTIKHDPWAFSRQLGDGWAIIDLEKEYYIDSLKLYDSEEWIQGYKLLVNATGEDADWSEVFSQTYEAETEEYEDENFETKTRIIGPDPKVGKLAEPVKARFVKLFIPVEMQSPGWNRIREFEIYGDDEHSGLRSLSSDKQTLVLYPNPVTRGETLYLNEKGKICIYSLQGTLIYQQRISGATGISTSDFSKGSYIIQLFGENGVRQAKIIVK